MADANSTRTFNQETITNIREALLIGLAAFGEIERLYNAQTVHKEDLRVIHPTGTSDTVSRFAEALREVC